MQATSANRPISLDQLLLDPNNFRLRDQDRWADVDEARLGEASAQRKASSLIAGQAQEGIADLIESLRSNGWLPVDQIQVRPYDDHHFVVVEGNRRVATLKHLKAQYEAVGESLGELDPAIFDNVPVMVQEREDHIRHAIHMGLVHITGKKPWSQVAESLAIREFIVKHALSESDVRHRLSISTHEVRLSMRALALCEAYKQSDWGDQFGNERYTLLREAVRNRAVKDWLEWDDGEYEAANKRRRDRLFALISQVEDEIDAPSDEGDDQGVIQITREPALRTRDHIRRLGKLLEAGDERAVRNLESSRDLTAAEQTSDQLGKDRVRNAVALINDQANDLFANASFVDDIHAEQLKQAVRKLSGMWFAAGRSVADLRSAIQAPASADPSSSDETIDLEYPPEKERHLSRVSVVRYRGVTDLTLDGLKQINILAGLNNAGKTSLLEAIRLLVSQIEPEAMFDILRRRGRMAALDMKWAAEQLPNHAEIKGEGRRAVRVQLESSQEHALSTSHPGYLRSLLIEGTVGDTEQQSTTHIYAGAVGMRIKRTGRRRLGPVVHSSPFSSQDPKVLVGLYDDAVAAGLDDLVIEQLGAMLDDQIEAIKLTSGPPPRFRVARRASPPPDNMDLGMYGDGLQRLFHIGLLFAHAQHGFVLIDELENGIHAGLLPSLARMVHGFAKRFDTQVFIATHSKECIDAFFEQPEVARDLRGFSLDLSEGRRAVTGVDGQEFAELVDLYDADLRNPR